LLGRLRIIKYSRLFNVGLFIHSPRWLSIFRLFIFGSSPDHYIVHSEPEISLYGTNLGIDKRRLHYLRWCDWSSGAILPELPIPEGARPNEYYCSGGYSNRDYFPLIEVFRTQPENLIIVCSRNNKELEGVVIPFNVRVLRDIPGDLFEAYVQYAKAGIVPLKYDTGASGQDVMLRLMRNKKLIIATDIGAVREYIDNGQTGFLVGDMLRDLPPIIKRINVDPSICDDMGNAAHDLYLRRFSGHAGLLALRKILCTCDNE